MPTVSKGKTEGQEAWRKIGAEMTPEEAKELKQLKDRLKNGEVLTYEESNRLHNLRRKQITVPHVE